MIETSGNTNVVGDEHLAALIKAAVREEMQRREEDHFLAVPPPMPPEIATAIAKVKTEVRKLVADKDNTHGGFKYAGVDDFYAMVGPLEGDAGLVIIPQHVGAPRKDVIKTRSGDQTVLVYKFAFIIAHASGANWFNPHDIMEQPVSWLGAQTGGAARSYAHKYYQRALYCVPTGEADADAQERWEEDAAKAKADDAKQRRAAGKPISAPGIAFRMANGQMQSFQVEEAAPTIVRYLLNLRPPERAAWAEQNDAGMRDLHAKHKAGWLTILNTLQMGQSQNGAVPPAPADLGDSIPH